jgi:hypothetical protein
MVCGSGGRCPRGWLSFVTGVVFALVSLLPSTASAALVVRAVSTTAQLVQLFADANANPNDTYQGNLSAGTYLPASTLRLSKGSVVLNGATTLSGAANYKIDCQNRCDANGTRGHVFRVVRESGFAGTLNLELYGVTVTRGHSTELLKRGGGAAWVENGSLSVVRSVIADNKASQWGAGLLAGYGSVLRVTGSRIENNENTQYEACRTNAIGGAGQTSYGGGIGILLGAQVTVTRSSVTGNKACRGGGIAVEGNSELHTTLGVHNSTISGNTAVYQGGGMLVVGPIWQLDVSFSTIAFNVTGENPNGDLVYGAGIAFRQYVAPAGQSLPLRLWGSVLAKNTLLSGVSGSDCWADASSTLTAAKSAVGSNFVGKNGNCSAFLNYDIWSGGTTLIGTETAGLDPGLTSSLTDGVAHPRAHAPTSTSPLLRQYAGGNRARNLPAEACAADDIARNARGSGSSTPTTCDLGSLEVSSCSAAAFTPLTLAAGWNNNAAGGGTAAYWVDCEGQVHLKGAISTVGASNLAFTLPAALRPASVVYVPVSLCSGRKGRLVIQPATGAVTVTAETSWADAQCLTSLDGVSFARTASGFTPLTLTNGWTNAPFSTRDAAVSSKGGIARLQGAIATIGNDMSPFFLPSGTRPLANVYVNVDLCGAHKGRLLIAPSGSVTVEPADGVIANAKCFTSLEGVWFGLTSTGYAKQTLLNGWAHASDGTRDVAASVESGVVRFQGSAWTFAGNNAFHLLTLPSSARPSVRVSLPVGLCAAAGGRLIVEANGNVTVQPDFAPSDATCFTSFEGVRFAR